MVYLTSTKSDTFQNLHYGGVDIKGEGYIRPPLRFEYNRRLMKNHNFRLRARPSLPPILKGEKVPFFWLKTPPILAQSLQILDQPPGKKTLRSDKNRHKIEDFIPVSMRTGANYYVAKCPFHDDQRASMWVDTAKQICGCYAGCSGQTPWDIINLFARLHNVSNNEAIDQLSRM